MSSLDNEQLRAISPFLVKDTDVLLFEAGQFKKATITLSSGGNEAFKKNATEWEKQNCPLLTGSNRWTAGERRSRLRSTFVYDPLKGAGGELGLTGGFFQPRMSPNESSHLQSPEQ